MTPANNQIISKIVTLIKKRRADVMKFIISHGGTVNKAYSDVEIGRSLSSVLSSNSKNREDFSRLLSTTLNATGDAASDAAYYTSGSVGTPIDPNASDAAYYTSGSVGTPKVQTTTTSIPKTSSTGSTFTSILGGVTGLFTSGSQARASAQQGSDAITLALINAGIQKQKTPTSTIIAVVVLGVIIVVIGILVYIKSKKS